MSCEKVILIPNKEIKKKDSDALFSDKVKIIFSSDIGQSVTRLYHIILKQYLIEFSKIHKKKEKKRQFLIFALKCDQKTKKRNVTRKF